MLTREKKFNAAVVLLGLAALIPLLRESHSLWTASASLLLIVFGLGTQIRLAFPSGRLSSLMLVPIVVCFAYSLPVGAVLVAAWAVLLGALVERKDADLWRRLAFDAARETTAVVCAWVVYRHVSSGLHWEWVAGALAASIAYLASKTGIEAVRDSLAEGRSPWVAWKDVFLPAAPFCLLAPVGVSVVKLTVEGPNLLERTFGGFLFVAGYLYFRDYLTRERDRRRSEVQLLRGHQQTIETMALAIEARDGRRPSHVRRLKFLAVRLARELGYSDDDIRALEMAAVLRDIGKIGVPDAILNKPARLTEQEFGQVEGHVGLGAAIVRAAHFPEKVARVVLHHHEHWDGTGYPLGLSGRQIPPLARVLTVVDCFNALVCDRPFRRALSIQQALELMVKQQGKIFDPQIAATFLTKAPDFLAQSQQEFDSPALSGEEATDRAAPETNWLDEARHETFDRKQNLQKLTSAPDQLLAFYNILDILGADLDFDQSLKKCLEILHKVMPSSKAGIFVLERDRYVLLQGIGFPDHCVSRLTLSTEEGFLADALRSGRATATNAAPQETPSPGTPACFDDIRSTLAAPLMVDNRAVGMIVLCSTSRDAFDQEQGHTLSLITGKMASTVLSSRRLRKIYMEAETDEITSLPNARAAFRKLGSELERARRHGETVAVLFMDMDRLKSVNDSYGHGAGDRLLAETGQKLASCLRSYDFLGRLGGDEFLAVLPGIPRDEVPAKVATLKEAVAQHAVEIAGGITVRVGVSIGAALFPEDATNLEELVYLSDREMYRDKEQSRVPSDIPSAITH
jgi:diguanylate cyclase (GGDEF)-like protein